MWRFGFKKDGMRRFSDTQRRNRNADLVALEQRIGKMEAAIQPLLTNDKARTSRWEDWKYNLVHATWRERGNKKGFYRMRLVAITSSIAVPSLVGLNLAGVGGTVVRWLTFGLSLVAAFATGILTLYRTGDRWLMYRRLTNSLRVVGYTLVDNCDTDPEQQQVAWKKFTEGTENAMAEFNRAYEATVIQVAQPGSDEHDRAAGTGRDDTADLDKAGTDSADESPARTT